MADTLVIQNTSAGIAARISWRQIQNPESNTSQIQLDRVDIRSDRAAGLYSLTGSITAEGSPIISLSTVGTAEILLGSSFRQVTGMMLPVRSRGIPHGRDGSARCGLRVRFFLRSPQGESTELAGETALTLAPLSQASELLVPPGTLGSPVTLRLVRRSPDYRDTVTYRCGDNSGVLAESTQALSLEFTPQEDWGRDYPREEVIPVVFSVTTCLGDEVLDSREVTAQFSLGAEADPTLSVTLSEEGGYGEEYGYLQGLSRLRMTVCAQGRQGADICLAQCSCGKSTAQGTDCRFALPDAGSVSLSAEVTDSRGRTAVWTGEISVTPYSPPGGRFLSVQRCDAQGVPAPEGAYCRVTAEGWGSALEGKNSWQLLLGYAPAGEETRWAGFSQGKCQISAEADREYTLLLAVEDGFTRCIGDRAILPRAFALLDVCRDSRSIGIGQRAVKPGCVSLGLPLSMEGSSITGLADPEGETDGVNRRYVDEAVNALAPVGGAARNGLFRGRALGSAVSDEQYRAISDGSFRELAIGDFWSIGDTRWVIAGFDYFLGSGDIPCKEHHCVLIPESPLYHAPMGADIAGGYMGSDMRKAHLNDARNQCQAAFAGHLLSHRLLLSSAASGGTVTGRTWCSATVELLPSPMVWGNTGIPEGVERTPLPLFQLAPWYAGGNWWLRDLVQGRFLCMGSYGVSGTDVPEVSRGVRPYLCLKG